MTEIHSIFIVFSNVSIAYRGVVGMGGGVG